MPEPKERTVVRMVSMLPFSEADDKDTKHSNVIHINFKGDKD
jgi:hypothetical protein